MDLFTNKLFLPENVKGKSVCAFEVMSVFWNALLTTAVQFLKTMDKVRFRYDVENPCKIALNVCMVVSTINELWLKLNYVL